MNPLELIANAFNAASIVAAGRNSLHTWWTGIVGCALFAVLFAQAKLYADSALQGFFIVTSVIGFVRWRQGRLRVELPVRRGEPRVIATGVVLALAVTLGYAWALARFTDAAAPLPDSFVLAFSVLGQVLLMDRRIETWWCWLAVNAVAVPLYASRGLHVTALLYAGFFINALIALGHWRKLLASAA